MLPVFAVIELSRKTYLSSSSSGPLIGSHVRLSHLFLCISLGFVQCEIDKRYILSLISLEIHLSAGICVTADIIAHFLRYKYKPTNLNTHDTKII